MLCGNFMQQAHLSGSIVRRRHSIPCAVFTSEECLAGAVCQASRSCDASAELALSIWICDEVPTFPFNLDRWRKRSRTMRP